MPDELPAVFTLLIYCGVALALMLLDMRRCPDGWRLWVLHVIARFYTPLMFRQRLSPGCPIPAEGGALLLANHRSPVDPILIFSGSHLKRDGRAVRRLEFLTAREYCELGGPIGWITRNMRVIPVERSGRDMRPVREALRRLQRGALVGIFPEGRINLGTELLPANPGVAWLALHAKKPVLPVFIHGAPQGKNMFQPFYTFSRVRVVYGDPIDLSAYADRRITQDLLEEVTELMMSRLAETGRVRRTEPDSEHDSDRSAVHYASRAS